MDSGEVLRLAQRAGRIAAGADNWLADDLAGHVMLKYYETRPEVDNFEAWAVRVARNKRVDVARQQQRFDVGLTGEVLEMIYGPGWSPSMITMGRDLVVRALTDLTQREQEVLLLRATGLPAADVGRRLGMASHAVDRMVSDARTKARLALADQFPDLGGAS